MTLIHTEILLVSLLRLMVVLSLLATSIVALAPSAAACTLGLGPAGSVCVTDFNHSYGDPTCQRQGYNYGSTYGYIDAAGAAQVSAAGDQHCMNSGSHQRETQQIRIGAAVWGVALFQLRFTDSDDSAGSFCQVDAHVATVAGGADQAAPCPQGVVPLLPWGNLLP